MVLVLQNKNKRNDSDFWNHFVCALLECNNERICANEPIGNWACGYKNGLCIVGIFKKCTFPCCNGFRKASGFVGIRGGKCEASGFDGIRGGIFDASELDDGFLGGKFDASGEFMRISTHGHPLNCRNVPSNKNFRFFFLIFVKSSWMTSKHSIFYLDEDQCLV